MTFNVGDRVRVGVRGYWFDVELIEGPYVPRGRFAYAGKLVNRGNYGLYTDEDETQELQPIYLSEEYMTKIEETKTMTENTRPLIGPAPQSVPAFQTPFEVVDGEVWDYSGNFSFHVDGINSTPAEDEALATLIANLLNQHVAEQTKAKADLAEAASELKAALGRR